MQRYIRDELNEKDNSVLGLGGFLAGFTYEKSGDADEALRYYDEALAYGAYGSIASAVRSLGDAGHLPNPQAAKATRRQRDFRRDRRGHRRRGRMHHRIRPGPQIPQRVGIDAALYAHPEFEDTVFLRSRWMRRDRAMITGTRSLTGEPERPLEAVLAAAEAVRSLPPADAIVEHIALDGDVEEGGGLVVRIHFLLRADEETGLDELAAPLRAALPDAVWSSDPVVCGLRPDAEVTRAVKEAVLALGGEFVDDPAQLPFGTDFGNVSQLVPSALIGIGRPGGWAFHTDEGAEQFAQDGEECGLSIARVLALAAARLLEPLRAA